MEVLESVRYTGKSVAIIVFVCHFHVFMSSFCIFLGSRVSQLMPPCGAHPPLQSFFLAFHTDIHPSIHDVFRYPPTIIFLKFAISMKFWRFLKIWWNPEYFSSKSVRKTMNRSKKSKFASSDEKKVDFSDEIWNFAKMFEFGAVQKSADLVDLEKP